LFREKKEIDQYRQKLKEAKEIWEQLGNEKNAAWCEANIEASLGKDCFSARDYEGAIQHFDVARELHMRIGNMKAAKFCSAYSKMSEVRLLRGRKDPARAMELVKSAEAAFLEASAEWEARLCKADYLYFAGDCKFKDGRFHEAREDFLEAAEIYERAGWERHSYYFKGRASEGDYRLAKLEGNVQAMIRALEFASLYYEKAGAQEPYFINMGDLYKFKGLNAKSKGKYEEALKNFRDAKEFYEKASGVSEQHRSRHKRSAEYVDALILSTRADYELMVRNDLKAASNFYLRSAEIYNNLGDIHSASFNTNIGKLLRAVDRGNAEQVVEILENLDGQYEVKPLSSSSIVKNVLKFVSAVAAILKQRHEEMLQELIEEDKGPGFEARVRELITKFDGRKVIGSMIGSRDKEVVLHRYDEVSFRSFTPEDDEIGIVFGDKSVVEIDALAVRREGGRRYILVCECKHCPGKPVGIKDLDLLVRKAEFVERRYGKIAELEGEFKPVIEEKWFVTSGYFKKECEDYASSRHIRLIDLEKLNRLMKVFRLRRITRARVRPDKGA